MYSQTKIKKLIAEIKKLNESTSQTDVKIAQLESKVSIGVK